MLTAARHGETGAEARLWNIVYQELRQMAAWRMAQEGREMTLQATELVHEAWLRISGADGEMQTWNSRRHFFGAASEAMRRILVDQARARLSAKRGSGERAVSLELAVEVASPFDERLLEVHEFLDHLSLENPERAQLVKLRFFVGLSHAEIAELMEVSERTVRREWTLAKTWLFQAISAARAGKKLPT